MKEVVVTVTYSGKEPVDLSLPWEVPSGILHDGILKALKLARIPNHELILARQKDGKYRHLLESESLADANILFGDCLELFTRNKAYLLSENGIKFQLGREQTTLGRSSPERKVDIDLTALDTPMLISRRQGTIKHHYNQYSIKDDNSRNGIVINGNLIPPWEYQILNKGDQLRIGGQNGIQLTFQYEESR